MANPYKPKHKTPAKGYLGLHPALLVMPGVVFLEKLKQVVDADKQDMITPPDVEFFLQHFYKKDTTAMMEFKTDLDRLNNAIGGKITEVIANPSVSGSSHVQEVKNVVYSTKDVASILNVQKQTVVNWVNNGWLVANQNVEAGKYHITEPELLKFLKSGNGKKYLRIWNQKNSKQ